MMDKPTQTSAFDNERRCGSSGFIKREKQGSLGYGFRCIEGQTRSRHDAIKMAAVEQNQERLERMIRKTMRVVRNSEALLQETNKLLDQFKALPFSRIKRPDSSIDHTPRQT